MQHKPIPNTLYIVAAAAACSGQRSMSISKSARKAIDYIDCMDDHKMQF